MISGECIFKKVCSASSEGCSLVHLMDYCQPIFISFNGTSYCGICGDETTCYPVNDQVKVCQDCMTGYVFQRVAQWKGIGGKKAYEISKRLESC